MAGKHLFEKIGASRYTLIVHRAIPTGSNAVDVKWADILEYAGITNRTKLQPSGKITSVVNVLDGNGDPIPLLDENDDPVVDENGDPVYQTETQIDEVVGVGQISDAEKAQIQSGARFEVVGTVKLSGKPTQASLTKSATRMFNDYVSKMKEKYNYCGQTQG